MEHRGHQPDEESAADPERERENEHQNERLYLKAEDQNVEQLRRFGSPNTYVNMLGLNNLFEEVNKVKTGVGKTVSDFTEAANGMAALKYTGQGLFQDLTWEK